MALGQDAIRGVVISVQDQGQPVADVRVITRAAEIQGRVFSPDPEGRVVVDEPAFEAGTPIAVLLRRCDGLPTEIVLTRVEEEDLVCPDETAGAPDRCECERIGTVTWQPGSGFIIDVGTGQISESRPEGGPSTGTNAGFKLDIALWPNLEDNICDHDGVSGCESDRVSLVPVAFVEYWITPSFGLGLNGLWSRLDATQRFAPDPSLPAEVDIEMTTLAGGPYAAVRWGLSPALSLQLHLGTLYMRNTADFQSSFEGEVIGEEKTDNGFRLDVGTAMDVLLGGRVGVRINLNYASGGSEDTDQHIRGGVGIRLGSL